MQMLNVSTCEHKLHTHSFHKHFCGTYCVPDSVQEVPPLTSFSQLALTLPLLKIYSFNLIFRSQIYQSLVGFIERLSNKQNTRKDRNVHKK